jgi:hypothetical protein
MKKVGVGAAAARRVGFGLAMLIVMFVFSALPAAAAGNFVNGASGPPNQPQLLQGTLCSWSGSSGGGSSFSTTRWARFDGRGRFTYGSNSSYSGGNGGMYNGGAEGGGTYEVRGDRILLHYDEGGTDVAYVYNRAGNGMITEVKFEGRVYAAALCE